MKVAHQASENRLARFAGGCSVVCKRPISQVESRIERDGSAVVCLCCVR